MEAPIVPGNEALRLKSLQSLNILDTPPEERFDRLTRMAKRMFRIPIALVSIVDENRQWFKSADGLAVRETPRDISFCGHTILGDDILVVTDARTDPRFSDNPLVVGAPYIRFYAGCPLRSANGLKIGTLCIIDTQPREFDEQDAIALRDLSAIVEDELTAFMSATTDDLTRIANRRGFMRLAQYSLNFCARQGTPATLAFIDLDHFKPINDTYGHAEGDRALINFSDCMRKTFRSTDIFARLGGDEFVVLLTSANHADAKIVMDKFSVNVEMLNTQNQRGYAIKFSYGITEFQPASHISIENLLAESDARMYAIKSAKKHLH